MCILSQIISKMHLFKYSQAAYLVPTMLLLAWLPLLVAATSHPSMAKQTYIIHMDSTKISALKRSLAGTQTWTESILESIHKLSSPSEEQEATDPPELLYAYETALSGFAARLSPNQFKSLQHLDGFISAYSDDLSITLHTTHSPRFLGLDPGKGLWSPPSISSSIVIGVVDTGVWPEHVSFSSGISGSIPSRWKGSCEPGTNFSSNNCNTKLVGARAFWKGYEAIAGTINETKEYRSARDSQGHGTHTASTAAGNVVGDASLFGNAKGAAIGMRFTSNIAAYKACWSSGCASSDVLAAVDQAVVDGVDILSLSLGASSRPYYSDPIAIATLGAVQKGVFVSCSAGNSGPIASAVSNTAPWIMTVAASYLDRSFPTTVKLGNGRVFVGASLYSGNQTKQLPIVYGDAAGKEGANYCIDGSLSPELVKGKIVLCDRGINGRTQKGEQVRLAGGAGMLLGSIEEQGNELFADAHVLPASSLDAAATAAVKAYMLTSKEATASISFQGTVYGATPSPAMAAFSSRGPSLVSPYVIKPDVTAPGMSILAAWPPTLSPSLLSTDTRRVVFNIFSGTSMSCPHVSGVAALLKSAHPDWSPAAVKSALMTTGYVHNSMNDSIVDVSTGAPATPFVLGSGHVDPERAAHPGLVYDMCPRDYLDYLCGLNYSDVQIAAVARRKYRCPSKYNGGDLNYPSFSVVFEGGRGNATVVERRTVTNVGKGRCRYSVNVSEPDGVSVSVEPRELVFGRVKEKVSYEVRFVGHGRGSTGGYSFGELVWVCGEYMVRSPIAVTWQ